VLEIELKVKISAEVKRKLFGVAERDQSRILKEKQPRARHNWPNNIAELTGVELPTKTGQFKVSTRTIRKACFFDFGLGNYAMEEERELGKDRLIYNYQSGHTLRTGKTVHFVMSFTLGLAMKIQKGLKSLLVDIGDSTQ